MMFEDFLPIKKIGMLSPLGVVDNAASEFYRLAPERIMLVAVPLGLQIFSADDVNRVFEPLDEILDALMKRDVDIVVQAGIPLPILIGTKAHDDLLAHIAARTGLPARSQLQAAVAAAKALGIERIVFANKWSEAMNATMSEFFAREGVDTVGVASDEMPPEQFQKLTSRESIELAYELGRRGLEQYPRADGLFLGGGTWISQPVAQRLEQEFDKPVFCNQDAMMRDILTQLDVWSPRPEFGRLMSLPAGA